MENQINLKGRTFTHIKGLTTQTQIIRARLNSSEPLTATIG